jgi:replicative DNA helicase
MRVSASYNAAKAAGVVENSFTSSKYKKLFIACKIAFDKFGENYTPQAVLDEAMAKYVDNSLPEIIPIILEDNYKYTEIAACDIVLDMYRRRVATNQADRLVDSSYDLSIPFIEIVTEHRKHLISASSSIRKQARTPQELGQEFWDEIKYREKLGGNLIIGHSFHALPSINMILGGIQPGHLVILAGDTGAGKSILALNMLNCFSVMDDKKYMWIGQEMASVENTMRLASIITGISNTRIQSGAVSQKEAQELAEARLKIDNSGFHWAPTGPGHIDEILALIDEYRWKYDIEGVFWDYIGMVTKAPEQRGWSREEILGYAATTIKQRVTVDMGLPAIILAQMNRDKHAEGKQKIGGSYRIIQDSDDFLWIETKTKKQIAEDGEGNGNRYVRVGKRRGGVDTFVANATLDTDPRTCSLRISECSTPSEVSNLYSRLIA